MKAFLSISICLVLFLTSLSCITAQGVAINIDNSTPDASAILDVKSTDKGMLVPRMSTAQRTGIISPATGLLVYDNDTQSFWFRDGTSWINLLTEKTGWSLSGNIANSTSFMGTTNNQSLLFKANNQQAGKIDLSLSNTFWGIGAGTSVTTGTNNTTNGKNALISNTTGSKNTAAGDSSLYANITGNNNTAIGHSASVNSGALTNATAIGSNAFVASSNSMILGSINGVNGATANVNVGIGTSSPTNKLEVIGKTKTDNFQMTAGAAAGRVLISDASGNAIWTPSTSLSITESDPLYLASPSAGITGANITNWNTTYAWGDHATAGYLKTETDPQVTSATINKVPKWNGTSLADGTIYDSGTNVGIGTSSPTNKLEVIGNTKTDNFQMTAGAAAGRVLTGDVSGNATWTPSTSLSITESDPFYSASPSAGITGANITNWNTTYAWGDHATAGYLTTETDPQVTSATTNKVPKWNGTSLSDGTIYDNGTLIGIGTSSPTNKLEVIGNTKTDNFQMTNGAANGNVLQSDANGNASWIAPSTIVSNQWHSTGNTGTVAGTNFLGTADAQPLMFKVNAQKAGYIDYDVTKANTGFGYQALNSNAGIGNTANGYTALFSNFTGSFNTANGWNALRSNGTGSSNTANGVNSLYSNSYGALNTANGKDALYSNIGGAENTANGASALYSNTTGQYNTANGFQTLYLNTTGSFNTANGSYALYNNVGGNNGVAIGYYSQYYANSTATSWDNTNTSVGFQSLRGSTTPGNNTGINNTAIGRDALFSNTTGSSNTANGKNALFSNSSGYSNTANGRDALFLNTIGYSNTATGDSSLYSNIAGNSNTANGWKALYSNNGSSNTANGVNALYSNTTGSFNTANGTNALQLNIAGSFNTATGRNALYSNTGSNNTATGVNALYYNNTGTNNTANGLEALYSNTTGSSNTASGRDALHGNSTGSSNTANGLEALYFNTTGSSNTANGVTALRSNTTGSSNTANGRNALYFNTTGYSNTANGKDALYSNNIGADNTAIGDSSLYSNTTGSNNTTIGHLADVTNGSLTNATAIGYNAKVSASNSLVLGGTGSDAVKVGIGTQTPTSTLQVVGLPVYADNAAALAGGLTAGAFYRTATGVVMVVY